MKLHEREYFISRIRSGVSYVNLDGEKLKVLTPTVHDEYEMSKAFIESYDESLAMHIKNEDEMLEWMIEKGFWSDEDDQKIKGLEKDLDKLRIEIFKARNNEGMRDKIRIYLRAGEKQLLKLLEKKQQYKSNTCEGLAAIEKSYEFIKRCTFRLDGSPYLFDAKNSGEIQRVLSGFFDNMCTDAQTRELARSDPWKSIWILNDTNTYSLFHNDNRELSIEQKNLLIWSRMYDNIQESMECPSDSVINDDDMLDGWFIIQKQKREKERAESELGSSLTNDKIKNADEVFMMAGSDKDANRIDMMNDMGGQMTKKKRMALIKQRGTVNQLDFQDERLKLQRQSNQGFKDKFNG